MAREHRPTRPRISHTVRRKGSTKPLKKQPKHKWQMKVHVLFVGSVKGVTMFVHEDQTERQRGDGSAYIYHNIPVDANEFCRGLRTCVIPFMAKHGHREFMMDGAPCYHTDRIPRTLRSCRPYVPGLRRRANYPVALAAGCARDHWGGYPPNSHDCNPLETVFADLQAEVGEYFIGHPKEATARRLREKVLEFWPRYAADLASLTRKQPGGHVQ